MAQQDRFEPDPDRSRDEKDEGNSDDQVPVEQSGREVAQALLHQPGDVGAEHDQFALRQVDHPHQAEDDRKADRRHEQNAGETQTVVERRQDVADRDTTVYPCGGGVDGAPEIRIGGIGRVIRERADQGQRPPIGGRRDASEGGDALGWIL